MIYHLLKDTATNDPIFIDHEKIFSVEETIEKEYVIYFKDISTLDRDLEYGIDFVFVDRNPTLQ